MVNHNALRVGSFMHAHTEKCIKCGDPNGDTVIIVQVVREPEGKAMELEGIGIQLCPQCEAKYLPLTPATDAELNRLGDKLWRDLGRNGCPHCFSGLDWHLGKPEVAGGWSVH
jgi:hypothetical protein